MGIVCYAHHDLADIAAGEKVEQRLRRMVEHVDDIFDGSDSASGHVPDQAEHASALYVTAFQVGILSGSAAGGLIYEHIGATAVLATTAVLFAAMLVGVRARGDAFGLAPTAPAILQTPQAVSTSTTSRPATPSRTTAEPLASSRSSVMNA